VALIDALDELVEAGRITHSLARRIIYNYDVSIQDNIGKCGVEIKMKVNICSPPLSLHMYSPTIGSLGSALLRWRWKNKIEKIQAKIMDYRFVESVWWFNLKDIAISKGPFQRRAGTETVRFDGPLRVIAVGYDATARTVKTRIPGHKMFESGDRQE